MDEIEKLITERLMSKREVVEKLVKKKENTQKQIDVCQSSLQMLEMKMNNTRMQIDVCESAIESSDKEIEDKNTEVRHMTQILNGYRNALVERSILSEKMNAIREAVPDWLPGDPVEMQEDRILGANEEYQKLLKRKQFIDELTSNAIADVNKIYYNRGKVSGANSLEED